MCNFLNCSTSRPQIDQFYLSVFTTDTNQSLRQFPDDYMAPTAIYTSQGPYNHPKMRYKAMNRWAATRGYAFVIGRFRTTLNGRHTVIYNCDRGAGHTPSSIGQPRQRQATKRRTRCSFSVAAKESLCKASRTLRHRDGLIYYTHNHEPSLQQIAHPKHRQLMGIDRSLVQGMASAGIALKEIRSYLRTQLETNVI